MFVLQFADFQRLLRRDRDSNPGYLAVQRFSRPPQSTTLPPLQNSFKKYFLPESGAKVRFYFKTAILLGEKNKKHYIFSLKTTYIPLFKSTLLINYYKKETMQNENPKIIMYICIDNRKNA